MQSLKKIPWLLFLLVLFIGSAMAGLYWVSTGPRAFFTELQDVQDIQPILEHIPVDAEMVLLGESTHGTHEYYVARANLSKALIERGSRFVAVEGDFAALFGLNQYIHAQETETSARQIMARFSRWPEWMWANEEFAEFVEWLREFNIHREPEERVSLYGMDVYGQWEAWDLLVERLKELDADLLPRAKTKVDCFKSFREDDWAYARALAAGEVRDCDQSIGRLLDLLDELSESETLQALPDSEDFLFFADQVAHVLVHAEGFYREAILDQGGPRSWNVRVSHMQGTLARLSGRYSGPGIVWAHNTHIGDARATEMAARGELNIGQLARESWGKESVYLLGFSTFEGKVQAGYQWGSPRFEMGIPQAMAESLERQLAELGVDKLFLPIRGNLFIPENLLEERGHRAIGVIYNSAFEHGNYVPTRVGERYDGLVFYRQTQGLSPVPLQRRN